MSFRFTRKIDGTPDGIQGDEKESSFGSAPSKRYSGQIKADGGDQGKFDNGMREIRKKGIQARRVLKATCIQGSYVAVRRPKIRGIPRKGIPETMLCWILCSCARYTASPSPPPSPSEAQTTLSEAL